MTEESSKKEGDLYIWLFNKGFVPVKSKLQHPLRAYLYEELHMSPTGWIGLGSCEVRRLTRAL